MNDWDSFIENCESEEYSACTVAIDGEKYSNIGIRAKGNTSLSNVKSMDSERYSFKLEFDQYETGKTYYGLDKLCLNNIIQDNTFMKDYLVYQMMDEFGADAPLCSYVYITVNGEDWGLYLAVEGIEDSFLQRNYGGESGDLYKPDSMSFGGGRGNGKEFNMDDFDFGFDSEDSDASTGASMTSGGGFSFDMSQFKDGNMPDMSQFKDGNMPDMSQFMGGDKDFDPASTSGGGFKMPDMPQMNEDGKGGGGGFGMGSSDVKLQYIDDDPDSYSNIFDNAKTKVSDSDKERLIESLKKLSEYDDIENIVDIDEVLRYFVVHNFVVNGDSYTGNMIHNYYLYEEDGKMSMIPWDYNLAFGTFQGGSASSSVNASIDSPVSGGDVDDRPMFGWIMSSEEYTSQYHELFSEFISEWIDSGKLEAMISDTAELIRPYVEKDPTKFCTTEEFETGVETMLSFVKLRGEAIARQLAGDDSAVECGDLNLSNMGSMGGGMGGGKDDSFGPSRDRGKTDANTDKSETEPNVSESENLGDNPSTPPEGFSPDQSQDQQGGPGGQMPQGGQQGGQMPQGGQQGDQMPQGQQGGQMPQGGQQGGQMPQGQQGGQMPQGGFDPGQQGGPGNMPTRK